MTAAERITAAERLKELEQSGRFSEETIRDLKEWWREKQAEFGAKILPFPAAKIIPFPRYAT